MRSENRGYLDNISKLAEDDALNSLGAFDALSRICGGRGESEKAWEFAHQCRRAVWSATLRHRETIRTKGHWANTGEAFRLGVWAFIGVLKGYFAAACRSCHIIDIVDLRSAQAALDQFEQLAA